MIHVVHACIETLFILLASKPRAYEELSDKCLFITLWSNHKSLTQETKRYLTWFMHEWSICPITMQETASSFYRTFLVLNSSVHGQVHRICIQMSLMKKYCQAHVICNKKACPRDLHSNKLKEKNTTRSMGFVFERIQWKKQSTQIWAANMILEMRSMSHNMWLTESGRRPRQITTGYLFSFLESRGT